MAVNDKVHCIELHRDLQISMHIIRGVNVKIPAEVLTRLQFKACYYYWINNIIY